MRGSCVFIDDKQRYSGCQHKRLAAVKDRKAMSPVKPSKLRSKAVPNQLTFAVKYRTTGNFLPVLSVFTIKQTGISPFLP